MEIVMMISRQGSPDGKSIRLYKKGETYSVPRHLPENLAVAFIRERWARETKTRDSQNEFPRKDSAPAPETKDLGRAPENKKKAAKTRTVRGKNK